MRNLRQSVQVQVRHEDPQADARRKDKCHLLLRQVLISNQNEEQSQGSLHPTTHCRILLHLREVRQALQDGVGLETAPGNSRLVEIHLRTVQQTLHERIHALQAQEGDAHEYVQVQVSHMQQGTTDCGELGESLAETSVLLLVYSVQQGFRLQEILDDSSVDSHQQQATHLLDLQQGLQDSLHAKRTHEVALE